MACFEIKGQGYRHFTRMHNSKDQDRKTCCNKYNLLVLRNTNNFFKYDQFWPVLI